MHFLLLVVALMLLAVAATLAETKTAASPLLLHIVIGVEDLLAGAANFFENDLNKTTFIISANDPTTKILLALKPPVALLPLRYTIPDYQKQAAAAAIAEAATLLLADTNTNVAYAALAKRRAAFKAHFSLSPSPLANTKTPHTDAIAELTLNERDLESAMQLFQERFTASASHNTAKIKLSTSFEVSGEDAVVLKTLVAVDSTVQLYIYGNENKLALATNILNALNHSALLYQSRGNASMYERLAKRLGEFTKKLAEVKAKLILSV